MVFSSEILLVPFVLARPTLFARRKSGTQGWGKRPVHFLAQMIMLATSQIESTCGSSARRRLLGTLPFDENAAHLGIMVKLENPDFTLES